MKEFQKPKIELDIEELRKESDWLTPYILPNGVKTKPGKNKRISKKDLEKTRVIQSFNVNGKNVLDVGCSEGIYSFYLAELGANVMGIDIDNKRIKKANFVKNILGYDNVKFEHGDILNDKYLDNLPKFDLIIAWGLLHRIPDPFNAIIHLGSKCDAISFEWRAPIILYPSNFSAALHVPKGNFEWKNLYNEYEVTPIISSHEIAEFWRITPGYVKALLKRVGFKNFKTNTIKREAGSLKFLYNSFRFIAGYIIHKNKVFSWEPSMRIHLLAERKSEKIGMTKYNNNKPKQWDGRFM